MANEKILEIARMHGMSLFVDLRKEDASDGEMLAALSFVSQGIIKWIANDTGHDIKKIRKTFNEALDLWLEDELKT